MSNKNNIPNACKSCLANNFKDKKMERLGEEFESADYTIALAGNPNTGKSTVFNNLTGLHQHTGNWPGKTVTRAEGAFRYNGKKYKMIDLPGTYSLLSTSTDEEVARDFILFGKPDVSVVVVDATRLERNLNLVLQVLEITDKAVLCLNLMDEAKRYGLQINVRALSKRLGIPVIPAAARSRKGMNELLQAIEDVASGEYKCKPHRIKSHSPKLQSAINSLKAELEKIYPSVPNLNWITLRLLEGDQRIIDAIKNNDLMEIGHSSE